MRSRERNHRIDRNAPRKRAALAAPLLLLAAFAIADSCRDQVNSVMAQSETVEKPDNSRHCSVPKSPDPKRPKTAGVSRLLRYQPEQGLAETGEPIVPKGAVAYWDEIAEARGKTALDMLRVEALALEFVGRDKDAEKFRKAHLDRREPAGEVIVVIDGVRYHVLSLKDKGQVFLFTTDGDPSEGKCLLIDGMSATLPSETCRPGDVENTQPPISPNPDGETYTA